MTSVAESRVQRLAPEEGRPEGLHGEHQDDADQERPDIEDEDTSDLAAEDAPVRVAIHGLPVVPEGPAEDEEQYETTDESGRRPA